MALSQRDLALIKEMIGSNTAVVPTEVKCVCNCITEVQVKALVKSLDDKLNALYTELQAIKSTN